MSRFRAALIHLLISASIVASVLAVVFFIWYPGWVFDVAGTMNPVFVLVGVDLVLGPTLTLIVYKAGKPGLWFDLWFIALVQLVALGYGSYTLYSERPHYLVFAVDRVNIVAKNSIDLGHLEGKDFADKDTGELKRIFARAPEDRDEFQAFLDSVLFDGEPDLERRTEYWEPWENGAATIREAIKPLATLDPATEKEQRLLDKARERYGDEHPSLGLIPVGGIEDDIGVLVDSETLEVLDALRVNPW